MNDYTLCNCLMCAHQIQRDLQDNVCDRIGPQYLIMSLHILSLYIMFASHQWQSSSNSKPHVQYLYIRSIVVFRKCFYNWVYTRPPVRDKNLRILLELIN